MIEVWKSINGYDGLYEVSNYGRVRSLDHYDCLGRLQRGRVLKPQRDGKGLYLHIGLWKDGKSKPRNIHRLVAEAFIPNPNNLPEVNHKDENKLNNSVSNLEWCDHKYNNNYGSKVNYYKGSKNPQAKLTTEQIIDIRKQYVPYSKTHGLKSLSEKYGISQSHLSHIINGSRWGWLVVN